MGEGREILGRNEGKYWRESEGDTLEEKVKKEGKDQGRKEEGSWRE